MALNLVGTSDSATIDAATGIDGFSIVFLSWTTLTRPGSPSTGQTGFNTTTGFLETWSGSAWVAGGGASYLSVYTHTGSTVDVTVSNNYIAVLTHGGSTVNVPVA